MSHKTALSDEALRQVQEIGQADILVGIPSYRNAATIGYVAETAGRGLVQYFSDLRAVLVNSDGDSPDGTRQAVLQAAIPGDIKRIVTVYQGLPGKGSAFRAIFEIAHALKVKACVVVDSDLRSITPDWIRRLAGPIVQDECDYVTPYYVRHKYDGTITNNIAYPMTRMLYGLDVRQPIGGDFGFSGALAETYLAKDVWESDVARFGIDIWMTTTAINEGFRLCQANLGAKIHDAKDPAQALGPMFAQVVGTLFSLMALYEDKWPKVRGHRPAALHGEPLDVEPEPIPVTQKAMIDKLRAGLVEYGEWWAQILSEEDLRAVKDIAAMDYTDYRFPAERWAPLVYDFAVAYNKSELESSQIMQSMIPLYYGRTAGLVQETRDMTSDEAEEIIQAQARVFEGTKSLLIERWGAGIRR
jgi:hypothetical protein